MTEPLLHQTSMKIVEDQETSDFTMKIFFRVKNEINCVDKYIVLEKDDKLERYIVCIVSKYMHKELKRKVCCSYDSDKVRCDCYWFKTKGILCRHIFIVIKNLQKSKFPPYLVKSRWLKDAKEIDSPTLGKKRESVSIQKWFKIQAIGGGAA